MHHIETAHLVARLPIHADEGVYLFDLDQKSGACNSREETRRASPKTDAVTSADAATVVSDL